MWLRKMAINDGILREADILVTDPRIVHVPGFLADGVICDFVNVPTPMSNGGT